MAKTNYKESLSNKIFEVISQASAAINTESYVIGGFVRDLLLKRDFKKDIDIVAVGSGIELALKVSELLPKKPKVQVFKNYGTAMLRFQDIDIEFVGARKESYEFTSRNPIVENGTLEDDQNRRDFTINALALSLNEANFGDLSDPFNGLADLESKTIKTPLNPDITYSDDPLRMMRGIRFAAQLDFEIEEHSLGSIKRNAERIKIISGERIVEELNKILSTDKPSTGFLLLYKTGLLDIILPELTALNNVEEIEGHTHKNNFYHTLEVVDNICPNTDDVWLRWSALLHDIGKAPTKRFYKKQGWTFHGHEFLGGKMVKKIFERLHMPLNQKMKFVQKMVMMSSRPIVLAEDTVTDSAVRRLVFDAGEDVENLMTLCEADITTKNPNKFRKYHDNFKVVRQKIVEVEERDHVRNFQPPITGEEIMEIFNLQPSREIGILKEAIKEAILEGDIPNEYQAAYDFMMLRAGKLGLIVAK
ncbi:tRNA nucleotidyltransferase [Flavobacterium noncentrifugens]|uniref:tRNA nucleotidyltransferase (CCA-adding enzyme) n=1 Tax=Flavobacterium noncentrifugens TaxID=1128970 RepID=A0A1G8VVB2_9FLAO|nr:HD domain-containing protein [Flavobacterium noncentrifugens]GEP50665.1 tRNA nucleotidyltransferase [Flavobacterium noncentrifugens]SDJ69952.1 tRNA nucleotidyltransferase (CCA-adding enzyme) [Flavobacterium noncentrifugens]